MHAPSELEEFLRRNRDSELLRFTTAGSVDDGKSTLIGRLLRDCKSIYDDQMAALTSDSKRLNREEVDLALLTDGLKSEREQGITIDVAYRYFSTPARRFIIADTPGHEQYTRNMATGASTADLAVVLIDARHGVLTQSRRHAFITSLLGIPHMAVCVNKMDLVGYRREVFEDIVTEFSAFTSRLQIPDCVYIPISALKGDNVVEPGDNMPWHRGPTLLRHLETVQISTDRNLIDLRFPAQYITRPNQEFRGIAGRVASGIVRVGDEIAEALSGRRSRVARIATFDGDLPEAFAGQSVTLCLEDDIEVGRGNLLAHPNNMPHKSHAVEAMLIWMADTPLKTGRPYRIKHTTRTVQGVFTHLRYRVDPDTLHRQPEGALGLNDIGRVALEAYQPLIWDPYSANRATGNFIVIDPETNATVGAGMIIERIVQKGAATAPPPNLRRERSPVKRAERGARLRQKPVTLWLTGLSGSGKSTLAGALEQRLFALGHLAFRLDGDNVRHGLNRDLGFSASDRSENIRRVAEVAALMNEAGVIAVCSLISPYRADRANAAEIIGHESFLEVFIDAPLAVCEERDPKNLYKRARAGEIVSFTGINAPYEPPEAPDLHIRTDRVDPSRAVDMILERLRAEHILPPPSCMGVFFEH